MGQARSSSASGRSSQLVPSAAIPTAAVFLGTNLSTGSGTSSAQPTPTPTASEADQARLRRQQRWLDLCLFQPGVQITPVIAAADPDDDEVNEAMWRGIAEQIQPTLLPPGRVRSAVVIGAGASGLMAARALADRGVAVTILEGRDRVGGRLYTDGHGMDWGGHWIHGGGPDASVEMYGPDKIKPEQTNPVRLLCDRFGIETKLTDGDSAYIGESEAGLSKIAFFLPDGSTLSAEEEEVMWNTYEAVIAKVGEAEAQMKAEGKPEGDMSLMDAISNAMGTMELNDRQRLYVQWNMESMFAGDYGEDAANLSFWNYDGGETGPYREFPGGDRIVVGGFGRLMARLAEPVQSRIKMGKVVNAVDYSQAGVDIRCGDGSCYSADVVLCTLPLGVLQRRPGETGHVAFSPPLPEQKVEAIGRLRMAVLNKLQLVFDQCYWPADQYSFAHINENPGEYPSMIVNMNVSHGEPSLVCMVGGEAGRALEHRSLEDNVAWAMRLVRKLFGPDVPEPLRAMQTAWEQDPFSYGAFSCVGKGAREDDQLKVAAPVGGKLFFAGEHTNALFWGSAHGAVVSGVREASRILGDASLLKAPLPSLLRPLSPSAAGGGREESAGTQPRPRRPRARWERARRTGASVLGRVGAEAVALLAMALLAFRNMALPGGWRSGTWRPEPIGDGEYAGLRRLVAARARSGPGSPRRAPRDVAGLGRFPGGSPLGRSARFGAGRAR